MRPPDSTEAVLAGLATYRGEPVDPLDLPTAAHVEAALRVACQALKVESSVVLAAPRNSPARAYAYQALRRGFPDAPRLYIGAQLGAPPLERGISYLRTARDRPWYRADIARRAYAAVLAVPMARIAEAAE